MANGTFTPEDIRRLQMEDQLKRARALEAGQAPPEFATPQTPQQRQLVQEAAGRRLGRALPSLTASTVPMGQRIIPEGRTLQAPGIDTGGDFMGQLQTRIASILEERGGRQIAGRRQELLGHLREPERQLKAFFPSAGISTGGIVPASEQIRRLQSQRGQIEEELGGLRDIERQRQLGIENILQEVRRIDEQKREAAKEARSSLEAEKKSAMDILKLQLDIPEGQTVDIPGVGKVKGLKQKEVEKLKGKIAEFVQAQERGLIPKNMTLTQYLNLGGGKGQNLIIETRTDPFTGVMFNIVKDKNTGQVISSTEIPVAPVPGATPPAAGTPNIFESVTEQVKKVAPFLQSLFF